MYHQKMETEEEKLNELNEEIKVLCEAVHEKEVQVHQLGDDLIGAEQAQKQKEADEKKRYDAELAARQKIQPYVPIEGDIVDELMAKHLNESQYYINVRALGEGHYMFGQKKIFARIMNEKLVIKHGNGFMLIDEFIKNYGDSSTGAASGVQYSSRVTTNVTTTYTSSQRMTNVSARTSPKRNHPGAGSPTNKERFRI